MSELPARGRDSMGRFIDGNVGGPGRKPREVEKEYLEVLTQVVSPDVWRRLCERAVLDALNGDARARQWISDYALGQPISRVQQIEAEEDPMSRFINEIAAKVREEENTHLLDDDED